MAIVQSHAITGHCEYKVEELTATSSDVRPGAELTLDAAVRKNVAISLCSWMDEPLLLMGVFSLCCILSFIFLMVILGSTSRAMVFMVWTID